jgi:hypothetical protein
MQTRRMIWRGRALKPAACPVTRRRQEAHYNSDSECRSLCHCFQCKPHETSAHSNNKLHPREGTLVRAFIQKVMVWNLVFTVWFPAGLLSWLPLVPERTDGYYSASATYWEYARRYVDNIELLYSLFDIRSTPLSHWTQIFSSRKIAYSRYDVPSDMC